MLNCEFCKRVDIVLQSLEVVGGTVDLVQSVIRTRTAPTQGDTGNTISMDKGPKD